MSRFLLSSLLLACSTTAISASATTYNGSQANSKGYYPGMLIVKNEYVRLQDCTQRQDYALTPSGKYGYETMAELISTRKNTPVNIPISVGLLGEIEYDAAQNPTDNFLVRGLEFIKQGESCNITFADAEPLIKESAKIIEATTVSETGHIPPSAAEKSDNTKPVNNTPPVPMEIHETVIDTETSAAPIEKDQPQPTPSPEQSADVNQSTKPTPQAEEKQHSSIMPQTIENQDATVAPSTEPIAEATKIIEAATVLETGHTPPSAAGKADNTEPANNESPVSMGMRETVIDAEASAAPIEKNQPQTAPEKAANINHSANPVPQPEEEQPSSIMPPTIEKQDTTAATAQITEQNINIGTPDPSATPIEQETTESINQPNHVLETSDKHQANQGIWEEIISTRTYFKEK